MNDSLPIPIVKIVIPIKDSFIRYKLEEYMGFRIHSNELLLPEFFSAVKLLEIMQIINDHNNKSIVWPTVRVK